MSVFLGGEEEGRRREKKVIFRPEKCCVSLLLSSNCASARRRLIMAVVHSRNCSKTTFLTARLLKAVLGIASLLCATLSAVCLNFRVFRHVVKLYNFVPI